MNNYLKGIRSLLFIGQLCVLAPCIGAAREPMLDEKEMQQLESELAEFNKMYENMSDKEKSEFNNLMQDAVEEVRKGLSDEGKQLFEKLESGNISDEEIDKLLNELVPPTEAPQPAPAAQPAPVQPVEQPVVKAQPKQIITDKHQARIDCVRSLIALTNSFIIKAGSIPEFPNKIKSWEQKGKITWKKGQTWNKLKSELEIFVSLLAKLIERDKKTGDYLHLDELLKNESLYNNLNKLEKALSKLEPKVEEISPLVKKLSTESKEALQKILNQYHEALYTLQIPQDLVQVIEKFEPLAKKMRESQEAIEKKATEEGRRPRTPGAPITAGRERETDYGYTPSYESGSSYGNGNYYNPTYGYEPYSPSSYEPSSPSAGTTPSRGSGGYGSPSQRQAAQRGSEDGGKPIKGSEQEQTKAEVSPKKGFKPEANQNPEVAALFRKIEDKIDGIAKSLETTPSLADIKTFATNDEINLELANKLLPDLLEDLDSPRKGVLGDIKTLKMNKKQNRENSKKQLQEIFKRNEKALNTFMNQVSTLEKEWDTVKANVPLEKQFAYFGNATEPESPLTQDQMERLDKKFSELSTKKLSPDQMQQEFINILVQEIPDKKKQEAVMNRIKYTQIKEQIKKPISLFDLNKKLMELKNAIQSF